MQRLFFFRCFNRVIYIWLMLYYSHKSGLVQNIFERNLLSDWITTSDLLNYSIFDYFIIAVQKKENINENAQNISLFVSCRQWHIKQSKSNKPILPRLYCHHSFFILDVREGSENILILSQKSNLIVRTVDSEPVMGNLKYLPWFLLDSKTKNKNISTSTLFPTYQILSCFTLSSSEWQCI